MRSELSSTEIGPSDERDPRGGANPANRSGANCDIGLVAAIFGCRRREPEPAATLGMVKTETPQVGGIMHPSRWFLSIGVVLALIVSLAVAPTPAGALVDEAVVVPTPDPNEESFLKSVSCVSESFCIAVGLGSLVGGGDELAQILAWDGSNWSIVPISTPGDRSLLLGVSCLSESQCTAVGFYRSPEGNKSLVLMWDGTTWEAPPVPTRPGDGGLDSVSCVSETRCTAVGSGDAGTLVMTWDGAAWTIVPSPSPGDFASLESVSCVTESWCTAVGYFYEMGPQSQATLVLNFDGVTWSAVPSPNSGSDDLLQSVWCVSTASCVAVGSTDEGSSTVMLALIFDGATWSIIPTPNVGADFDPREVSCVSVKSCVVVGRTADTGPPQAMVVTWDGTTWSSVPSPSPGEVVRLASVSCVNEFWCMAVGGYNADVSDFIKSLAMTLTGTPPPPPTPPEPVPSTPVTPAFTG